MLLGSSTSSRWCYHTWWWVTGASPSQAFNNCSAFNEFLSWFRRPARDRLSRGLSPALLRQDHHLSTKIPQSCNHSSVWRSCISREAGEQLLGAPGLVWQDLSWKKAPAVS